MNEKQLEDALRSLEVPPPDATSVEKAWRRARAELNAPCTAAPTAVRRSWRAMGWAAVPVAAVLAFLIVKPSLLSHQDVSRPHREASFRSEFSLGETESSKQILREVRTLFPNHLQAVIIGAKDIDIRLHAEATRVSDQPILVELNVPGVGSKQLISFSGQTIETTIGDRPFRLELLLAGGNGVLIAGDDFVWTKHDAVGVTDLQIRAQRLEMPL